MVVVQKQEGKWTVLRVSALLNRGNRTFWRSIELFRIKSLRRLRGEPSFPEGDPEEACFRLAELAGQGKL